MTALEAVRRLGMSPEQRRKEILDKISAANGLLLDACQLASPLNGWAEQWTDIGDTYDAVNLLWHRIHEAPAPGELDDTNKEWLSQQAGTK